MQPDTAYDSIARESLERRHEVGDRSVRNVLMVGGAAALMLLASLLVCGAMIDYFSRSRPMQPMRPLGLILAPDQRPFERFPRPNLQLDDDRAEMTALRAGQEAELNSYGWVDRSNGIVRIPIDRAMDLILQRGLPARTNDHSGTDGSALQLIQNISHNK